MDKNQLTFEDALQIARACKGYGGGYRSGEHYEVFQHGIETVIRVLGFAKVSGIKPSQIATYYVVGGGEKPTEEKSSKPKVLNVNDTVRVKLTDHGRAFHAKDYANFQLTAGTTMPYTPPKEDAEGWSQWKLWQLMYSFGPHMCLGGALYFEADIEVVE